MSNYEILNEMTKKWSAQLDSELLAKIIAYIKKSEKKD